MATVDHTTIDRVDDGFDARDRTIQGLRSMREGLRAEYKSNNPFPHIVVDSLFDPGMLREVLGGFDLIDPSDWEHSNHILQRKSGTSPSRNLPACVNQYFELVHSSEFVECLSFITGIEGLVVDKTLFGGGLHNIPAGGRFELHVDFQRHPKTNLQNRFVLITYLNDDWLPEYGGDLELWSWTPRTRQVSVTPVFGRTLLMEVGPRNVHGHPTPTNPPGGRPRRSVATYFYSEPIENVSRKSLATDYVRRPNAKVASQLAGFAFSLAPASVRKMAKAVWGRRRSGETVERSSTDAGII